MAAGLTAATTTTTPLQSPQQAAATTVGDLPAGLQTFYLTDPQTLQQVGINQLSAEVQQQILQRQMELQVVMQHLCFFGHIHSVVFCDPVLLEQVPNSQGADLRYSHFLIRKKGGVFLSFMLILFSLSV